LAGSDPDARRHSRFDFLVSTVSKWPAAKSIASIIRYAPTRAGLNRSTFATLKQLQPRFWDIFEREKNIVLFHRLKGFKPSLFGARPAASRPKDTSRRATPLFARRELATTFNEDYGTAAEFRTIVT
jgi:hypothetical protein